MSGQVKGQRSGQTWRRTENSLLTENNRAFVTTYVTHGICITVCVCGLLGTDACVEMEMVLNGIKYQHDKSASGQTLFTVRT